MCNVGHYVLENSWNAGGCALPDFGREGWRAWPLGDVRAIIVEPCLPSFMITGSPEPLHALLISLRLCNGLQGVLGITEEPLVSVDFRCSDVSSTIDASLTMVMGDDLVKVVAWYDNEWGYSQRVVDLAEIMAQKWQE